MGCVRKKKGRHRGLNTEVVRLSMFFHFNLEMSSLYSKSVCLGFFFLVLFFVYFCSQERQVIVQALTKKPLGLRNINACERLKISTKQK